MPYARDLSAFPLTRFAEVMTSVELLPSRRLLADHINQVVNRLEKGGVTNLEELRKLLAQKGGAGVIADRLGVDAEYVRLLRREVNSYKTRTAPLSALEALSDGELQLLAASGIRSTRDLYDACARRSDRISIAEGLGIDLAHIEYALCLANLVRIGGVGPSFARFFASFGIRGPDEVLALDSDEIAALYNASPGEGPTELRVVAKDIDYCKRYSEGLQTDIEW